MTIYNYGIPPLQLFPSSFVQAISDREHLALRVCSFIFVVARIRLINNFGGDKAKTELVKTYEQSALQAKPMCIVSVVLICDTWEICLVFCKQIPDNTHGFARSADC